MFDIIDNIYRFCASLTFGQFLRYFWFFFFFDFLRYVILDVVVVVILDTRKRLRQRPQYKKAARKLWEEEPLVSIIAPGKNEGKHIPDLARSLLRQTYPNIEIIIVDDGSDDNTPEICRKARKQGLIDQFFRNDVRGGKASAANLALRYCRGKFVIHIDADSKLESNAVEKILIPFYMDKKIGAIGGNIVINNPEQSLAATLQGIEYAKSITMGRRVTSYLEIMRIISGAYGAFRKDLLDRIGGWDVGPGLDGDITLKHRKMGYKVIFEPYSNCYTNCPVLFKKLAKQRYRWDRSLVRFRMRKHKDLLIPDANFEVKNFFAAMDNIFFNLLLNLNWWVYTFDIFTSFPNNLIYIIPINYLLFIFSNFAQFSTYYFMIRSKELKKKARKQFVYLPLMPIYSGLFLRVVRTYAYIMEFFFKKSYEDAWNPWKVSRMAKKKGL